MKTKQHLNLFKESIFVNLCSRKIKHWLENLKMQYNNSWFEALKMKPSALEIICKSSVTGHFMEHLYGVVSSINC